MASDKNLFDARLELIPQEPGVYLMKDATGSVLYVGKAVRLQNRLRSYFCPHPQGNAKTLSMISQIADFDYLLCANELEALILENNFIKQYQPKYNVLLRDDKEYPYIRITLNEAYPRVLKSFHVLEDQKKGAQYYGPYLGSDLFHALEAIGRIFPLKRCRKVFPRDIGKERPCLNYHIGRCMAPCLGSVPRESYQAMIDRIVRFLDGHGEALEREIAEEMQAASAAMRYEEAALLRDRLQALRRLLERQLIVSPEKRDGMDIIGTARNAVEICLQVLKLREGRLISSGSFFFPDQGEDLREILAAFLMQHYGDERVIPPQILLEELPTDEDLLRAYFLERCKQPMKLLRPQRGAKKQLLDMASENAAESLRRHSLMGGSISGLEETLRQLADELGLAEAPRRIEAYDVANLGADDRAVSMVVFEGGKPARKAYRHFSVKSFTGQDDPACLAEVLGRRLARLTDENFGQRPQLILLDGGKAQIGAVKPLLAAMAPEIAVAAMLKDERHRSRALLFSDGRILELRVSEEAGEDGERRASRRGLLRLVTAIQDEAHRFAGRLHKKLRGKRQTRWSLEELKGIGPARRRALLRQFGSMKALAEAGLEEIRQTPGLPEEAALICYRHFHPEEDV